MRQRKFHQRWKMSSGKVLPPVSLLERSKWVQPGCVLNLSQKVCFAAHTAHTALP
ncbi:rCG40804 [Rattus norvegicus]|uniref:RCG40804 n=1 Tax=Rattus norvegicus TaxID=10116 RepID=A6KPN6_RAT|nr:rCG40804 [Rattus norvegicus]